jgi:hypothetical protein
MSFDSNFWSPSLILWHHAVSCSSFSSTRSKVHCDYSSILVPFPLPLHNN